MLTKSLRHYAEKYKTEWEYLSNKLAMRMTEIEDPQLRENAFDYGLVMWELGKMHAADKKQCSCCTEFHSSLLQGYCLDCHPGNV